jgi:acetyl esterase/lipase
MKYIRQIFFLIFSVFVSIGFSQEKIKLYSSDIPNSVEAENKEYVKGSVAFAVSQPELSIFLPENKKKGKTAVIICPGGSYTGLWMVKQGYEVAEKFRQVGVAAFVLKYRIPDNRTCIDKSIAPLQDAQRAILLVRENADKWGINPQKIGMMGFSAGGHLASTAGTHFNKVLIPDAKSISVRPDFMILVYPVISMEPGLTHAESRDNLLGASPSKDKIDLFSNEKQVTAQTPPTFLLHASDDALVPVENTLRFYEALKAKGVSADMHIFSVGNHGFLIDPALSVWFDYCAGWMREKKLILEESAQIKN